MADPLGAALALLREHRCHRGLLAEVLTLE
jgi:hypothetical protein